MTSMPRSLPRSKGAKIKKHPLHNLMKRLKIVPIAGVVELVDTRASGVRGLCPWRFESSPR